MFQNLENTDGNDALERRKVEQIMKKGKGKMVRDLVITGVILFVGCFMGVSEAKNAGWLSETASASRALQTKGLVSETETEAEMAAKETEKPLIYNNPVYRVDHDENGNAKVTIIRDYHHKDTDKTSSFSSSETASTFSYSHTAGGGGGSTGSFINSTDGTGSSSYSGSGSSSGSSYKSKSSYKSSSGSKKYDLYDVYDYDDADDFADDWAEEFGDDNYDDGYDDAYDYWEDEMDD